MNPDGYPGNRESQAEYLGCGNPRLRKSSNQNLEDDIRAALHTLEDNCDSNRRMSMVKTKLQEALIILTTSENLG